METVEISKSTLLMVLDALMNQPYIEVAPLLDAVYGEVGDKLVEEPSPAIIQ